MSSFIKSSFEWADIDCQLQLLPLAIRPRFYVASKHFMDSCWFRDYFIFDSFSSLFGVFMFFNRRFLLGFFVQVELFILTTHGVFLASAVPSIVSTSKRVTHLQPEVAKKPSSGLWFAHQRLLPVCQFRWTLDEKQCRILANVNFTFECGRQNAVAESAMRTLMI